MRAIITKMAPWPKTNCMGAVGSSVRPITVGYARILSRISIDDIVGRSVSGIPAEVQSLFDNPVLTAHDLISIPNTQSARKDPHRGTYLDLALGQNIKRRKGQTIECDGYVGSAGKIQATSR
jgi:hypothetical protein